MTRFVTWGVALLCLSTSAFAFDFKGIELGAKGDPKTVEEKLGVKCGRGAAGMTVCNGNTTVAGATAFCNLVINAEGNIQRISLLFPVRAFQIAEEGLLEKFGAPQSSVPSVVQNRMGASFEQKELTWKQGPNTVVLSRYGSSVEKSALLFFTEEDVKMLEGDTSARKKDL